ncbi:MAG: hypothetical protein GY820_38775 [Gammaproteobacteria bacterium]|nr:hypothetical protein [Gammaproteobacteria bacterium]
MRLRSMIFVLLLATTAFGQSSVISYGPVHTEYLEQTVKLESGEVDTIIIQFAPSRTRGGNIFRPPSVYDGVYIDSLASDALPYVNWTARNALWSGYAEFELIITNVDLALDSLLVPVYGLDRNGNVRSNDVCYLKFATAPSYSTTAYYNAWVSATTYKAHCTGFFGFGTYGLMIPIAPTDDTASKSGIARLRVYVQ